GRSLCWNRQRHFCRAGRHTAIGHRHPVRRRPPGPDGGDGRPQTLRRHGPAPGRRRRGLPWELGDGRRAIPGGRHPVNGSDRPHV
ncbi:MAG: hypothetical protein AVDCRST_MAG70-2441, partial [uncultured Thermomicrobiales bacterium]